MHLRVIGAATMAVFLGATSVLAQSVASVGGPAELPPAGYKGQQYVDSRGCVYLKAGLSGQVNWVLRVGRDRKPMCNQTPTFGAKPTIEVATAEEMAAPAPETVVVEAAPAAKPSVVAETVKTKPAAPLVVPSIAAVLEPDVLQTPPVTTRARVSGGYETTSGGNGTRRIGCFTSAPVAERVKLRNGGTAVVCTRGDGTLTGWRPPVYADGAGVGASLSDPPVGFVGGGAQGGHGYGHAGGGQDGLLADGSAVRVPKGYKLAWEDDRLNPKRAQGTAQGWADQDQVWTRDVPAEAVTTKTRKKRVAASASAAEQPTSRQSVSTKSVGGTARTYIQVGTFGVAANADGAAARLKALGLPVARAKVTKGGKGLQIVMAGPFASASDAHSVLSAVRGAGFGDAFVK